MLGEKIATKFLVGKNFAVVTVVAAAAAGIIYKKSPVFPAIIHNELFV